MDEIPLDLIHRLITIQISKTLSFGNCLCLYPQVTKKEKPCLLGPLVKSVFISRLFPFIPEEEERQPVTETSCILNRKWSTFNNNIIIEAMRQ
jgi:hypothetical protein